MSTAEEKTGECVVCCHRCGEFLMEFALTSSHMVCPECGARLVISVKAGKVSVFDEMIQELPRSLPARDMPVWLDMLRSSVRE